MKNALGLFREGYSGTNFIAFFKVQINEQSVNPMKQLLLPKIITDIIQN